MPSYRYFIRAFLASFVLMGWLGHSFVTPPHAQAAVTAGREHPFIRVQEGMVSVNINDVPLRCPQGNQRPERDKARSAWVATSKGLCRIPIDTFRSSLAQAHQGEFSSPLFP
jgi:hypothetical protein